VQEDDGGGVGGAGGEVDMAGWEELGHHFGGITGKGREIEREERKEVTGCSLAVIYLGYLCLV
jgi:hypothetical protein